jgi:hypothetical protein
MSKTKYYIFLLVLIIILGSPSLIGKVYSWWDVGHKAIVAKAIDYMPEKWYKFFKHYQYFLEETSLWPDTVLAMKAGESYNHYYDSEYPLEEHITNPEYGRLPWRVDELVKNLTDYIKQEDWYNVLVTAGVLSHYLADSSQPYHSTKDYNPPLTRDIQAPGVQPKHAVVERTHAEHIDEIIPPDLNITPTYIDDPFRYMFQFLNESYSFLDEMNSIVLGEDVMDPSDDRDWPELKPIFVNRTVRAIWLVSSMWYTAIVDAEAIDKAPDPAIFMELDISLKGMDMPSILTNVRFTVRVVDKLGVPVDPDNVKLRFGDDLIELKRADLGEYSGIIPPEILSKYGGTTITVNIDVSKEGYEPKSLSKTVTVPLYEEEKGEEHVVDPLLFIGVTVAIVALAATIYLIKRR